MASEQDQSNARRIALGALAIASAGFAWAVSFGPMADPPGHAVTAPGARFVLEPGRPLPFHEVSTPPDRKGPQVTIILPVVAYVPPANGTVQVIVRAAAAGGVLAEIGRFGIFPDEPFTATTVDKARRYQFPVRACASVTTAPCYVKAEVEMSGVGGNAAGARVVFAEPVLMSPG
jgi:hypothetical protein